jgi:hypothetical protein
VNVISTNVIVDPKSGCRRKRTWNAAITTRGFMKHMRLSGLKRADDKYRARKMIMANFANSDGWKEEGQNLIHLRAPLIFIPIPGTNTRAINTTDSAIRTYESECSLFRLNLYERNINTAPTERENMCLFR